MLFVQAVAENDSLEQDKGALQRELVRVREEMERVHSLLDSSHSTAVQQRTSMWEKCAVHYANRSARSEVRFLFYGWKHTTQNVRRLVSLSALTNERGSLESVDLQLVWTSWLYVIQEGRCQQLQVQLEEEVRKAKSAVDSQVEEEARRLESENHVLQQLSSRLQRAEEESVHLETQVSELERKLRTADNELHAAQELNQMLRQEMVQQEDEYENRCQELCDRLAVAEHEVQNAQERAETAERELAKNKHGVTVANAEANVAETQLRDLKRILVEKRDLLRQNEDERHELIEQLSLFKERTADAERAVQTHCLRADAADARAQQSTQLEEASRTNMLRELNALQEQLATADEDLTLTCSAWTRVQSRIDGRFEEFVGRVSIAHGELAKKVRMLEADLARKDDEVAQQNERAENLLRELRVEEQVGHHQEAQILALEDEVRGLRDKVAHRDWQDWSIRLLCRYERQTLIEAIDVLHDERRADKAVLDERLQQLVQETQKHGVAESMLQEQKREAEDMCIYITDLQSTISTLRAKLAECQQQQAEDKNLEKHHTIMERMATKAWTSALLSHVWGKWQHATCVARESERATHYSTNEQSISEVREISKLMETLETEVHHLHDSFAHMQQHVLEKVHEKVSRMENVSRAMPALRQQVAQLQDELARETESYNAQRLEMADALRDLKQQKEQDSESLKARADKAEAELANMAKQHGVNSIQDTELRKQVARERERAEKAEAELSRSNELREALAHKTAAADERWGQERAQLRLRIEELCQELSKGQISTNILADLESKRSSLETELQRCASRIQELSAEGKRYKEDAENAQSREQVLQDLVCCKDEDLRRAQDATLKARSGADRLQCEVVKKLGRYSLLSRVWGCWTAKNRHGAITARYRTQRKNRVMAIVWQCWDLHRLELTRRKKLEDRALTRFRYAKMAKSMRGWVELRSSQEWEISLSRSKHADEHADELKTLQEQIEQLKQQRQQLIDAVSPVLMTLTLDMDFSDVGEEGSPSRKKFENSVKDDLARASGIGVDSIAIKHLSPGSVIVDVEFQQDQSETSPDPLTAVLELQKQMHDPDSAIHRGVVTSIARNILVPDKEHFHGMYRLAAQRHTEAQDEIALMRTSLDAMHRENAKMKKSLEAAQDESDQRVDKAELFRMQDEHSTEVTALKELHAAEVTQMQQQLDETTAAHKESEALQEAQFNDIVALAAKHEATIADLKDEHLAAVAALEDHNSRVATSLQAENRHLSGALERKEVQCRNLLDSNAALQQRCRMISIGSPCRPEDGDLKFSTDISSVQLVSQRFKTKLEQQLAALSREIEDAQAQIADLQSEPGEEFRRQVTNTDAVSSEQKYVNLNTTLSDAVAINQPDELTVLKAESCAYRAMIKDSLQALHRELTSIVHACKAAEEDTYHVFAKLQMDCTTQIQAIEQEVKKQTLRADKAETDLQSDAKDRLSLSEWGCVQRQLQEEIFMLESDKKALLLERIKMSMFLNQMETSKSALEVQLGIKEQQCNAMANFVEQHEDMLHDVEEERDTLVNDLRSQLSDSVSTGKSLEQEVSGLHAQLLDLRKSLGDEAHGKTYYKTCYAKAQMELDDLYMRHAPLERKLKQIEDEVTIIMHIERSLTCVRAFLPARMCSCAL